MIAYHLCVQGLRDSYALGWNLTTVSDHESSRFHQHVEFNDRKRTAQISRLLLSGDSVLFGE
jgi:hypothetical protein